MFSMKFLRGANLTRPLRRWPRDALLAPHWPPTLQRSPLLLRPISLTIKATASRSFHSQARLFARPQYTRQQYSRDWQQQREQQYQQYQGAKPLLSPSAFRSPSFKWIIFLSISSASIFYATHIETVPVSGRRRFNCFSEESAEAQGEMAYQQILEQEGRQGKILGPWDSRTRMVNRVMARLIEGGGLGTGAAEGKPVGWEINVIEDDSTLNAFVLPGGKVFVYSGILPICQNDSGLAAVLGHEIAHNLCGHTAERMSSMVMIQPLLWGLMYLDLYFTGTPSGLGKWLGGLLLDLGVMKPSSRQQESEADYVGLLLMAQSCYDPKESVGLWERMEQAQKGAPPEWLSTHPSNEHRIQRITEWLPKAEEERSNSGCGVTLGYSQDFQKAMQGSFW